ncbi:phage shock protein PspA [Proteobacteria bacterium 005FR1]|nr:phage shock protein PspA [Proteobacteria bacterium 005FR1]
MGIFSRISDIINANINALLDSAENPEKMIRLVIQEMEETLVEVRTNSAKLLAEKKELLRRNERLQKQAEDWQRKAELALGKNREDLAKAALVEKSTVNDLIEVIGQDLHKLDETLERLTEEIEQLQAKLNDAKARQKVITMRTRATQSRVSVNQRLNDRSYDSAMSKLDYFEQKIEQMESQIEADNIGRPGLHSEFEELEMQDKIDQELQALKARVQGEQAAASKPESKED